MTESKKRGFAAMDPKKVAEIASKGGKAAHAAGTGHQFTSEEARRAGRKGGVAPHSKRGGVRKPAVRVVPHEELSAEKGLNAGAYVADPTRTTNEPKG